MAKKQKLELTWIGKDKRPKLEPRILLEDSSKSYHAKHKISENDLFDNRLIFGDNLLALKALEQEFTGKIKCVYIDPPYNTGQAFENYEDGLEHSIWLSLMRERFFLLRKLLSEDGTFFCQLNDDEMAYCRVLLDEIFGRKNFINQISVKMKQTAGASGGGEDKRLKKNIEYILIYAKNIDVFEKFNEVQEEEDLFELIEEMRENGKSWKYTRVVTNFGKRKFEKEIADGSGNPIKIYSHQGFEVKPLTDIMRSENLSEQDAYSKYFETVFRDTNAQSSIRTRVMDSSQDLGEFVSIDYVPNSGRSKGKTTTVYYKGNNRDQIAWLKDVAFKKGGKIVKLEKVGTYWEGFPLNNLTKEGGVRFPNGKKPEALIKRVVELATNPGDTILDSFAGSGTTGAVAHKMGRQWILVELGEHCHTHIIPRMTRVIDGADSAGITKEVDWKGGGGFRYQYLAPSLIMNDKYGQPIINKEYNAAMLAEAMCKLMGFSYAPNPEHYWMHGFSSETDFIYVTTNVLTHDQLKALSEEVGTQRTLFICCKAFKANADVFENLTIRKIPQAVLTKCEWGKDDYSLNVANLQPQPKQKNDSKSPSLFDEIEA